MRRLLIALFVLLVACPKEEKKKEGPPPRDLAQHAERLGRKMTDAGAQSLLIAQLGAAFARAERPDDGRPYLEEAERLAKTLSVSEKEDVLAAIAAAQALGGDVGAAEATAAQIGGLETKSQALAAIAGKLAEKRRFQDSRRLIGLIPGDQYRAEALAVLVKALVTAKLFDEAGRTAASISVPERRAEATAAVAVGLFEAKRRKRAETALESLTSPHWKAEAVAATARMRYRAGAVTKALEIVEGIESDWIRARTYADLSGLAAKRGRRGQSRTLLQESIKHAVDIDDSILRATALTDIAVRLIDRGRVEAALEVLDKASGVTRRRADAHLAGWYARSGDLTRALEIHGAMEEDVVYGSEAASLIGMALADQGKFVQALDVAGRIRTKELRLPVLSEIAVRHAVAGEPLSEEVTKKLEAALFQPSL